MFFIIGINDNREELPYNKEKICPVCGSYGRDQVFFQYTELRLFFIPTFKWNKKYILQRSCCQSTFELNPSVGQDIENGHNVHINKEDLKAIFISREYRCSRCGSKVDKSFDYCPSCGGKL